MTPELIMLVGIPGCGKSTWVQNFFDTEATRQYSIISSDYLIEKAALECGITYDEAHKLISQEEVMARVYGKVAFCVKNEFSMIWDQTNLTADLRRQKLSNIPLHWHRKCVSFEISIEEVKRRRDAREAANPGKNVPSDVIENMISSYERPTKIEGWDEVVIVST
jgi:tRNA uridine 5-carbamoylmethylation protein Kti12